VLFKPRLRWLLIPGVLAMHVAIRLAIGLDYFGQGLTVLIVFVNWPVVVAWVRAHNFDHAAHPSPSVQEIVKAALPADL
jgi:chromate transport protein ChrA